MVCICFFDFVASVQPHIPKKRLPSIHMTESAHLCLLLIEERHILHGDFHGARGDCFALCEALDGGDATGGGEEAGSVGEHSLPALRLQTKNRRPLFLTLFHCLLFRPLLFTRLQSFIITPLIRRDTFSQLSCAFCRFHGSQPPNCHRLRVYDLITSPIRLLIKEDLLILYFFWFFL